MNERILRISLIFYLCLSQKHYSHIRSLPLYFIEITCFSMFILLIDFSNYSHILLYLSTLIINSSNGFKIGSLFGIPNKISYLLIFPLIFPKNESKSTKIINQKTKCFWISYRIKTITCVLIGLLLFLVFACFENLDEIIPHIEARNSLDKFLKRAKNPSIGALLWLNENEINWDSGMGCESEDIDQGRSYVDEQINISNCFFSRYLSYDGNGGAIYVSVSSYSMNINNSVFYNCVCSDNGGAIWFSSTNSYFAMICANSCSASIYYQFAYISTSHVNQVEYLSVSNCSHTTSGSFSIRLKTGNQRVDNTNSSMNNVCRYSGIAIYSPSSFSSSHCTLSNNNASGYSCIYLSITSGIMSYANIIHNHSPSWGVVYVSGVGSIKMMYFIFQNNQNYLFCIRDGSFEVSHSFIDHSGSSFSTSTAVSTSNNNSFTYRTTYQLYFFNSLHCNADIPLIEQKQMITIEPTFLKSFSFLYLVIIQMIS